MAACTLLQGDALTMLKTLPDNGVHVRIAKVQLPIELLS
jgi:hypothetical protein